MRIKIVSLVLILLVVPLFPIAIKQTTQTKTANFVLSEWDHPDEHGQGIYSIYLYQWYDPAWVNLATWYWYNRTHYELNSTLPLKVRLGSWLNNTVVGANGLVDGQNYVNYTISVSTALNSSVFYTHDLTLVYNNSYVGDTMFMYHYEVELNVSVEYGATYTVQPTFDINMQDIDGNPSIVDNTMYFLGSDGWQHDCSTSANVSNVDVGQVTITSDGDILTLDNTDNGQAHAVSFWIEEPTQESINSTLFPFLSINVTYVQAGGEWSLALYDNTTLTTIYTSSSTGVFYFNINDEYDYDPNQVYFYVGGISAHAKTVNVSWVKIYSAYEWTEITELEFYFTLMHDEWGLDTSLTLLGLILIPVSGLYLAYSVNSKKGMTADKGFYFLLMFLLGIGLFIGGIMP